MVGTSRQVEFIGVSAKMLVVEQAAENKLTSSAVDPRIASDFKILGANQR
jgi:hypothetical protein